MKNISSKIKEFLGINWFKLGIIILLLFGLVGTYTYLTNSSHEKLIADKEVSCRNLATKYKADNLEKSPTDGHLSIYEFKYDLNTDACILAYVQGNLSSLFGFTSDYFILNLFSGEKILSKVLIKPGQDSLDAQSIFDTTKDKYFSSSLKLKE